MAITKNKIENPDRYTYDEARVSFILSKKNALNGKLAEQTLT